MVYFANEPAEQPSLRSSRVPRSGFFLFRQMKIVQSFILKLKDHTAEALAQLKPLTVTAWWLVDTVDSGGLTQLLLLSCPYRGCPQLTCPIFLVDECHTMRAQSNLR